MEISYKNSLHGLLKGTETELENFLKLKQNPFMKI
jgi:hypothetical protein